MKSRDGFLSSRTMLSGSSPRNLKRNTTTTKTSLIRRRVMRWMNGRDLLIAMPQNLRSMNLSALSADNISPTQMLTLNAQRILLKVMPLQTVMASNKTSQTCRSKWCSSQMMSHLTRHMEARTIILVGHRWEGTSKIHSDRKLHRSLKRKWSYKILKLYQYYAVFMRLFSRWS